jgi:hypothetical protein
VEPKFKELVESLRATDFFVDTCTTFNTTINTETAKEDKSMSIKNILNTKVEHAVMYNGVRLDNQSTDAIISVIQELRAAFDTLEALDLDAEVIQYKLAELDEAIETVAELLNNK